MNTLARLSRQARRAISVHGVLGSARLAYDKMRAKPTAGTSAYDRRWNVETDGNEDVLDLTTPRTRDLHLCVRYQPTAEPIVREMLGVQALPYRESIFIDVGSGKGRALLVASEYPFRKIIGVEFGRELHEIAVANMRAYHSPTQQCRDIHLMCADATAYALPPVPTVLFMANPFHGPIMAAFIKNVERSLRDHPRPFYVLYRQPKEAALWDASPSFRRMAESPLYVNWRAL